MRRTLPIVLALLGLTAAVYWPVARFGFVDFDDPGVVTDNPHVAGGLTAANARWALTGFAAGHWEPLTWWSLQLDRTVWGIRAGPMHVENAALHAVGAVVLYGLLASATGAAWRSAVVAAVFAVHPVHVESVAWVTERRDVLSTPLLLAAVWAFVRYARADRRRWAWQAAFLALYGLSLSAKATGITLPALLLFVPDRWPLGRRWRLWEKVPAAALATAAAVAAVAAQRAAGAASSLADVPVGNRLANAVVTPWLYVAKLAVPTGLAAYYPFEPHRPWWGVLGAGFGLFAFTTVAWRQRHRRPYLLAGWGWFLVALLPTSGLLQSGPQGMADRYTYVPSIGLTAAAAWAVADAVPTGVGIGLAAVATVAMVGLARRQVGFWRDTSALRGRVIAVAAGSGGAAAVHVWLGAEAARRGDAVEARRQFDLALSIDPSDTTAHFDRGNLRLRGGRPDLAVVDYAAADPADAAVQLNWGVALLQLDRPPAAYGHLRSAERINPDLYGPHFFLGQVLLANGRREAAAREFAEAVRCDSSSTAARRGLDAAGGVGPP